jgi:serine protease AprX
MSALWGTGGKRGEGSRASALWGKGGRTMAALTVMTFVAVVAPLSAIAGPGPGPKGSGSSDVYVTDTLLSQAQSSPHDTFNVIVQGDGSKDADKVARQVAQFAAQASKQLIDAAKRADAALLKAQNDVANATANLAKAKGKDVAKAQQQLAAAQAELAQAQSAEADANTSVNALAQNILQQNITDEFSSITGVAATLTGDQILNLVKRSSGLLSITPNAPVGTSGDVKWSSTQLWPYESHTAQNWGPDKNANFASRTPSIAVVDSGIQSNRADFGSRVIASVNLSTIPGNTAGGDQRGHGTFVAGVAADGLPGITGADPAANLVDVKIMNSEGIGLTSDIINACQWILKNAATDNIKVVNFSLHSTITAPFYVDPLDRAVEALWFNGITVVVAAGNYGSADGPSGVLYSPGDDPFVITVGAADIDSSPNPNKASVAPWSAWGYTVDGFAKPELSAPGRYMIGPVPADSTLVSERPDNVTSPGYIQLSGTSFAAPVVAGAAATALAEHPDWTPDQVKGALMLTAKGLTKVGGAGGVGVIQADQAVHANNPPNPNLALEGFLKTSSSNGVTTVSFDSASWNSAVQSNASWNSASWNSASWNSASWNSASWNSVSWNSASWNSASWNSASWNSVSWNSASWNDSSHEDAAEGDSAVDTSSLDVTSSDLAALLADPTFDPTTLPPDLQAALAAMTSPTSTTTAPGGTTTTTVTTTTSP